MVEARSERQLFPEEQARVDELLLELPEEQRGAMKSLVSEFLQGRMGRSHFDDLWTRLSSLERAGKPRNVQDEIWATVFSFDRNPLG